MNNSSQQLTDVIPNIDKTTELKKCEYKQMQEIIVNVGMSALQIQWYQSIILQNRDLLNGKSKMSFPLLFHTYQELRKVCNHPLLMMTDDATFFEQTENNSQKGKENMIANSGKLSFIDQLLPVIINEYGNRTRIVIYSALPAMIDILENYCLIRGCSYVRIDAGNENEKIKLIEKFNDKISTTKLVLLSISEFSRLPKLKANALIFYDNNWTSIPTVIDINVDIGHKDLVKLQPNILPIFHLVTEHTFEEKLLSFDIFGNCGSKKFDLKKFHNTLKIGADIIVQMAVESTIKLLNIEELLQSGNALSIQNSDRNENEIKEEEIMIPAMKSKSQRLREILHHPSNAFVIRLFFLVFIAMLIIPTTTVIFLNKYVLNEISQFQTLSVYNKQTISIIIGVFIAHGIALIYLCYAFTENNEYDQDIEIGNSEIEVESESISDDYDSDHYEIDSENERSENMEYQSRTNLLNSNYSQLRKRNIKS